MFQLKRRSGSEGADRVPSRRSGAVIEALEDRLLLSVITWVNRGQASDRFAEVFGAQANAARQVVDAVIQSWERVIVDFNYQPIFGIKPSAYELTLSMRASGTGFGASANVTDYWLGKPYRGTVSIGRGNDTTGDGNGNGAGWFIDPTPNEHSEFNGTIVNAFAGNAHAGSPANGLADFYSIVAVEMTHNMGLIHHSQSLYQSSGMLTNTNVPDTAHGGGTGFYWVFNGPSLDHLMTSYDSGGGGTNFGPGVHSAGPGGSNQPLNFGGKTYQGANDTGNALYSGSRRYLVPNTMRLVLQDAYGYTTANPAQWGTFYSNLNTSTGELLVRGGAGTSADVINVSFSGSTLTVSVDVGDDIPATGHLPGAGNLPAFVSNYSLSSVSSIRIEPGSGNDTIRINSLPSGKPVTINAGAGDDTLHIAFASGNLNNVVSPITFNGGTGNDTINIWDDLQSSNRTFTITNNSITRGGFGGVTYSSAETIILRAGGGNDFFTVSSTASGTAYDIRGGAGDDTLSLANASGNLNNIAGAVTFNGGTGNDEVRLWDNAGSTARTYSVGTTSVTREGFAGVTFSNTEELVVHAGGGNDVFNTNSTANMSVTLNGGAGDDVFNTNSTGTGTSLIINGGSGNDTLNLSNILFLPPIIFFFGNLDNVAGPVTFTGGSGTDTINLHDGNGTDARNYTITNTTVNRLNFGGLTYSGAEGIVLNAAGGNDTFNVNSTSAGTPVTINGGAGDDNINLSRFTIGLPPFIPSFFGNLGDLPGAVTFNGSTGSDTIRLHDGEGTNGRTYTVTSTTVNRSGFGGLTYSAAEALILSAAGGADTFNVNSTNSATPVTLNGGAGNDQFNINAPPSSAVTVNGGNPTTSIGDGLLVLGTPTATGVYTPSGTTPGNGTVLVNGVPINFTGIETPWNAVEARNFDTFRFVTPNSQDAIDVATVEAGAVNVIQGTSGGVEMVRLLFRDVKHFILDTGANDGVGGGSHNDTVTVHPFGVGAVGLETFRYIGGTGNDTLTVNHGTFTFFNDPSVDTANLRVNVNTDNTGTATVRFTAPVSRIALLGLGTGGNVVLPPGSQKVLVTDNIFGVTAGTIDLTTNGLIVAPGGGAINMDLAHTAVAGGYNGGAWNGIGITSSTAAVTPGRAVGMALSGEVGISTFMGVPVSNNTLLMRYTYAGDANLDLKVNIADLGILAANWQQTPRYWHQGNFNFDLLVNIADLGILAANWQAGVSASAFSDNSVTEEEEEEADVIIATVSREADPAFARDIKAKISGRPSGTGQAASQGRAGGRSR